VDKNDVVYILDTNTLSDFWRYGDARVLGRRIAAIENPQIHRRITIITVEEMIGGRIEALRLDTNTMRNVPPLHVRHKALAETYEKLREYWPPLPFDDEAQSIYESLRREVRTNARRNDCKIAAIAIRHEATVISANAQDFIRIKRAIPLLLWEDWTIEPI
jgi:predicted nucleic acid-binding protein